MQMTSIIALLITMGMQRKQRIADRQIMIITTTKKNSSKEEEEEEKCSDMSAHGKLHWCLRQPLPQRDSACFAESGYRQEIVTGPL